MKLCREIIIFYWATKCCLRISLKRLFIFRDAPDWVVIEFACYQYLNKERVSKETYEFYERTVYEAQQERKLRRHQRRDKIK